MPARVSVLRRFRSKIPRGQIPDFSDLLRISNPKRGFPVFSKEFVFAIDCDLHSIPFLKCLRPRPNIPLPPAPLAS